MARDAWPKRWTNVKVRFFVEEMMLAFFCDDKSIGELQVTVLDSDGEKIAYLEGTNHHTADCTVGFNLRGLPAELLAECFHMARCFREFERTDNLDYANGFDYFRSRAVREWQSWILR